MTDEKKVTELTPEEIANMVKSVDDNRLDDEEKILGGTGVSIDDHVSDEELYDKFVYDPNKGEDGEKSPEQQTRTIVHKPPRYTKPPKYKVKANNRRKNKAAKKSRQKNRKKK